MPNSTLAYTLNKFVYRYVRNGFLDFPSAWLLTRRHMAEMERPAAWSLWNIEANIVVPTDGRVYRHDAPTTLDFFDFFGVHLSFWSDAAWFRRPPGWMKESTMRADVYAYLEGRISNDIAQLRSPAPRSPGLRQTTVALVPFSTGKSGDEVAKKSAWLFVKATFWSVRRQFDSVVLGACNADDVKLLKQLPAWQVYALSGAHCRENSGIALLDFAWQAIRNNSSQWSSFKYIYFTEADVVLYLRRHKNVEDALQKHGMLVPHRFNAFPAMQDFPPQLRRRLRESSPKYEAHLQLFSSGGGIREVQLEKSVDHCCLAGRLHACTQFWWTCEHCNSVFPSLAAVKLSARGLPVLLASHGGLEFCGVCQAGVGRRCPCASTGTPEINR